MNDGRVSTPPSVPRFGRYPEYRDSGVEWLGQVPAHWEIRRLGAIGRITKCSGGTKADEVAEGIPCVRYGDLYTSHGVSITRSRTFVSHERADSYSTIKNGDLLFAASGETIDEIGTCAVNLMDGEAVCGGDVILLRPAIPLNARFLGFAANSPYIAHQKSRLGRGMTVMHIYGRQLKDIVMLVPLVPEQRAIADFLDRETARIDELVAKQEQLIHLFEEKRTALIARAVTCGLDPVPNAFVAGTHAFQEVPNDWQLWPIRRLVRQVKRPISVEPEMEYQEIGIRSWGKGIFHKDPVRGAVLGKKSVFCIKPGDLVLNIVFAWEGAVAVVSPQEIGMIASHRFPTFRVSDQVDLDYLLMVLQSDQGRCLMEINSPGAAGRNKTIRINQFLDEELPLPPPHAQRAIVAAFRDQEARLSVLTHKTVQAIHLLKESRAALISAAVTGKIDVREVPA